MPKIAVYPGSFDPITTGHLDIIERISHIFDHVIILVTESNEKKYLFDAEERMNFLKKANLSIQNLSGNKLKSIPIILTGNKIEVDISSLGIGMYIMCLSGDNFVVNKKFAKIN